MLLLGLRANAEADTTGLPGDHFDLYAMLDLFKSSASPEEFERNLNTASNHVNNLDLNRDGKVDYIRVVDYTKGAAHAITLQVPVNDKESQDVAVIEIESRGDKSAQLQVIGDELLYGKDYIIEPGEATDSTQQEKKFGSTQTFVFVNVWYWPCVMYVYQPAYVIWVSPWYWSYWPMWWSPWSPVVWVVYYDWTYPHHHHHHHCHEPRMSEAHDVYQPRRVVSQEVQHRTADVRARMEQKPKEPVSTEPRPAPPVQQKPSPQPKQPAPQPAPQPNPKTGPKPAPHPTPAPAPKPSPRPAPAPQPAPKPAPRPK